MNAEEPSEKLQKVLARAGLGSRREMEKWIAAGRVKVNGQRAELGIRVSDGVKITVDGKPIRYVDSQQFVVRLLAYNKPPGEVCTRDDPQGRPTVFYRLPRLKKSRWVSVGRLDFNTAGLLLLTNDGDFANLLMHPSSELAREYAVRIYGEVDELMPARLKKGVKLNDGLAKFDTISYQGGDGVNRWYHVTLKEGRNREVRRLWESQGITVSRLIRVRFACIRLDRKLRQGHWQELAADDIEALLDEISISDRD